MSISKLEKLVNDLDDLGARELKREWAQLYAEREAFYETYGFRVGDRAVLSDSFQSPGKKESGWYCYRRMLVPDNTGEIIELGYDTRRKLRYVQWRPDVEWSVSTMSADGHEHYYIRPDDKRHTFMLWLPDIRPFIPESDKPEPAPTVYCSLGKCEPMKPGVVTTGYAITA